MHKKPEKWNNNCDSFSYAYLKHIGFYLDGNINHLPNCLIKYNNYNNNLIYLKSELPKEISEKIIPYQTKIMNNSSGNENSYDYSDVPEQWTIKLFMKYLAVIMEILKENLA